MFHFTAFYFALTRSPPCFLLINKSRTVFRASVLLLIADDVIKCSKLQVEQRVQRVVSLHSFEHFMTSSVINKNQYRRTENCTRFVFYNKPKAASGQGFQFWGEMWGKQTKKRAVLFCVTFKNMSAIINNFSRHLIGLLCLQTKGSAFIGHKNDR